MVRLRALPWFLALGAALALLLYGHYRLVRVAIESDPACVAHIPPGLQAENGMPSAAKSACRVSTPGKSEQGSAR